MARCKFDWILSLSALVGCVLIGGGMASAWLTKKDLKTELQPDDLKPEDVKEILLKYVGEYIKISDYRAEELVDMCELSVRKCSRGHFSALNRIAKDHRSDPDESRYYYYLTRSRRDYSRRDYEEPIIKIAEYVEYCRSKLMVYCRENIDDVLFYLLGKVTEEDKELVRHLLESLREQGVQGNPTEAQVHKAYLALKESTYKDTSISSNREQIFRRRIKWNALYDFREVYPFLGELFSPKDGAMVPPGSDILLTEWFNLEGLINIFSRSVDSDEQSTVTEREIEELKSNMHDKNTKPEDMRIILKDFEDERVRIGFKTVEEWVGRCEFSIKSCSSQAFYIPDFLRDYGEALHGYAVYCMKELKEYCARNTEGVVRFFLTSISEDDKKLAPLYLESLRSRKDLDTATKDDTIMSYSVIRRSDFGDKSISANVDTYFQDKVRHLFELLEDMYYFFSFKIETKPVFKSTSESWWYDLGKIFYESSPKTDAANRDYPFSKAESD